MTNFAKDILRAFVDRIENISEQMEGLSNDRKEIFTEAASSGFDKAVIRKIIAARKKERDNQALFQEQQSLFEVYWDNLNS